MDTKPFAEVLDELCKERQTAGGRYSNVRLAAAAGVTHSYIAQLRRGQREPALDTILTLAEALDVHPAVFVGGRRDRAPASLPHRTFAQKLNALFTLVHPPGRPEFSIDAIVARVRTRGRELADSAWTISPTTLADLRSGKNPSPKLRHIVILAHAFGASPEYFFDEELAERLEVQLGTHRALAELGVEAMIMRAGEHPPEVHDQLLLSLTRALKPSASVEQAVLKALSDNASAGTETAAAGEGDTSGDRDTAARQGKQARGRP